MSHATRIKRDQRRERRARVRALLQPKLPAPLLGVWQDACYVWSTFCWLFETPAQLARREALSRAEHRERNDWIHHLERLVRQLVLVAALALNLILRPSSSQAHKPRQRRLRLAWPDRPASWRARFCMMPRRRDADAERPCVGRPAISGSSPAFPWRAVSKLCAASWPIPTRAFGASRSRWRGSRNRTLAPMRRARSRCAHGTRQQNVRDRAAA